jgi:hypothetical protein
LEHRPLELGEDPHHLEQGLASGCGRIDALLVQEEVDVSGVSTIETDLRFSGRQDFWIIVAARSEDETEIRAGKAAGGRHDQGHSARDTSTFFS